MIGLRLAKTPQNMEICLASNFTIIPEKSPLKAVELGCDTMTPRDTIFHFLLPVYIINKKLLHTDNCKPSFQTSTEERMSSCHIFHNTSYFSTHYNVAVIMHIKHFFQKRFEYIVKLHLSMS